MRSLYLSRPTLACYEGEQAPPPPPPPEEKTFSQAEVNALIARDRRALAAQKAAVEKTLAETLESKNLSAREKEELAARLEESQAASRTLEQQQAHEKAVLEKQYGKQLADEKKAREAIESLYHQEKTERALTDAAVGNDAWQPTQIVTILKPYTRLAPVTDEKGKTIGQKVLVDFPDTDADGQPTKVVHTPESAVRRMKELPKVYGNLFSSGVVSGVGSQATAGGPGGGKLPDVRQLTQEQYMKIRAEHPELLGLRPNKKR
jgi:hypothetical protein